MENEPVGRRSLPALFELPAILLVGTLYGLIEWFWQTVVRPAPEPVLVEGVPGLLEHLLLGLFVFGLPALAAALALHRVRSRLSQLVVWLAGLTPTLAVALDRLADVFRWQWTAFEQGGLAHHLRLMLGALGWALIVATLAMLLSRRPVRALASGPGRFLVGLAVLISLAAGPLLWLLLPRLALQTRFDARPSGPNVVLLSIDTLRQDAVGAYADSSGGSTPELDRWITRGRHWDGWAPSPWTLPSMGALFSGVGPTGNGAGNDRTLNADTDWWPERLRAAGYRTIAFVTNPRLLPRWGFARGFERFDHAEILERCAPISRSFWVEWWRRQVVQRWNLDRADRHIGRSIEWLESDEAEDTPWLLWVHLIDPHLPYHLRGPDGELRDPEPGTWVDSLEGELRENRFGNLLGARDGSAVADEAARKALHQLYLREVRFADRWGGRLLEAAERASADRGLLWIVLSDHGEEFWDDGGFEHGHSLHESVLRIPLAMGGSAALGPAGRAGAMKLQDVGPTLLSALGLGALDPWTGTRLEKGWSELIPSVVGEDRSTQPAAVDSLCGLLDLVAENMLYGDPRTRVLLSEGRSFERNDTSSSVLSQELCPAAKDSVHGTELTEERLRVMLLQLDLWRERARELGKSMEIDSELRRRLNALGYTQ